MYEIKYSSHGNPLGYVQTDESRGQTVAPRRDDLTPVRVDSRQEAKAIIRNMQADGWNCDFKIVKAGW